jgi:hypothetical protein
MAEGSRGETTYAGKDPIMEKESLIEEVTQALSKIMHPAIDRSLIDLGMIKDITFLEKDCVLDAPHPISRHPDPISLEGEPNCIT